MKMQKHVKGGSGEDGSQRLWEVTHAFMSQIFTEGHFLPVTVRGAEDAWINRRISEAQSLSSRSWYSQCDLQ